MTASRLLVVRLPGKAAGWEGIDSIHEYINRAIVDGVMVLGEGIKLELVELPPLGAVEIVADSIAEPETPVIVGAPPPSPEGGTGGLVVDGHLTAVSVPESDTPAAEAPLQMAEADIVASYRQAAKPADQIKVLADLNVCSKARIIEVLRRAGVELPGKAKRKYPQHFSRDEARALYDEGLSDTEMSERLGVSVQTVVKWRCDNGLQRGLGRPRKTEVTDG